MYLSQPIQATAKTKTKQIKKQRWCGFKNKYLSLTVLEAEKSQIKMLAYSCPVKA